MKRFKINDLILKEYTDGQIIIGRIVNLLGERNYGDDCKTDGLMIKAYWWKRYDSSIDRFPCGIVLEIGVKYKTEVIKKITENEFLVYLI